MVQNENAGYTIVNGVSAIVLAKAFCKEMRETFAYAPENLVEILKRNKEEPSDAICHSHDFCDANVVMDEAGKSVGIELCPNEVNGEIIGILHTEAYTDIWNEAWSLAKRAEFDADKIDAVVKDIDENGY